MEAWRNLAVHVLVRAAVDATGTNETEQQEALAWLNSQEGRGVLGIFGLIVPGTIKAEDLKVGKRNVYFRGGVSRATVWPA